MAEGDAEHALADQGRHLVLDPLRRAGVAEAGGETPDQANGPVRGPKQQRAGIGGDRPAVEAGDHTPVFDRPKFEQRLATLGPHWRLPLCVAVNGPNERSFTSSRLRCSYGLCEAESGPI
jgi:hypothetical protein